MFIGNGVVLGIKSFTSSSYFFFVIINFNKKDFWNQKPSVRQNPSYGIEEMRTTAIKLGILANDLKNKLLE